MKTVRFETADAVFSFSPEDVLEVLKSHASEYEATELMDFLAAQCKGVIDIPQEKKSFLYTALDLLVSARVVFSVRSAEEKTRLMSSYPSRWVLERVHSK
jgi:hypothetical protein